MNVADECLRLFKVDLPYKLKHVMEMKKIFEMYPFTDLAKDTSAPLFASKVDLMAELDAIAADPAITFGYDFHSRIFLLISSLNDAHNYYGPQCYTSPFTFWQPWGFASYYPDPSKEPVVKVHQPTVRSQARDAAVLWRESLKGRDPADFVGYTLVSVDGVDALEAIQDYADKYSGFSREADSRFNYVLTKTQYVNGKFKVVRGSFSITNFLGFGTSFNRTYVLASPDGKETVTFTVPWIVSNSWDGRFNWFSAAEYEGLFCLSLLDFSNEWLRKRELGGENARRTYEDDPNGIRSVIGRMPDHHSITSKLPKLDPDYVKSLMLSAETRLGRDLVMGTTFKSKAVTFNVTRPLVSDFFNAFYMLDDGTTGVWAFTTFAPFSPADQTFAEVIAGWMVIVTTGLNTLQNSGAKRLIIDFTGNGGGLVCASTAFSKLFNNETDILMFDVRLNQAASAFLKTDYWGNDTSTLIPVEAGTKILTNTRKRTRGGITSDFSAFFHLRSLRDSFGVRSYVYGGVSRKPYTPTSFEGGIVSRFKYLDYTKLNTTNLTDSDRASLPSGITVPVEGQIIINQAYSPNGVFGADSPAEWVPQPADGWVHVVDPLDKAALWGAVSSTLQAAPATITGRKGLANSGQGKDPMLLVKILVPVGVGLALMAVVVTVLVGKRRKAARAKAEQMDVFSPAPLSPPSIVQQPKSESDTAVVVIASESPLPTNATDLKAEPTSLIVEADTKVEDASRIAEMQPAESTPPIDVPAELPELVQEPPKTNG
ncbi:hypothetical protein HDU67_001182 [Dinochytrium kinnereticum]|nr:hypothetical protein HDU67_001182 [Dinochytrium kinnereticum]